MRRSDLQPYAISCPYCGERIDVLLDPEEVGQQYIEDCQVCCRPIVFNLVQDAEGELHPTVHTENDTF